MSEKKDFSYKFTGEGLEPDEKKWGQTRFNAYKTNYPHLNKLSNLQLLEELVWKEAIQERFKKQVGDIGKKQAKLAEENGHSEVAQIPGHLQESMDEGLTVIIELKTKLGMFEDQKTLDAFKDFQTLKLKAAEYRKTHPLQFKTTCIFCAKEYYLKRRTDKYEEFSSPFVEDKVLNNRPLFKLYKDGKISKEDVAAVLGVSPDYVDWLDEKIYGNVKKATEVVKTEPTPIPPESSSPEQSA